MKKMFIISIVFFFILNSFSTTANDNMSSTEEIKLLNPYLEEDNPFIRSIVPFRVYVNKDSKELQILNYSINNLQLKIGDKEYRDIISSIGKTVIDLSENLPGEYMIEFTESIGNNCWIGSFVL